MNQQEDRDYLDARARLRTWLRSEIERKLAAIPKASTLARKDPKPVRMGDPCDTGTVIEKRKGKAR